MRTIAPSALTVSLAAALLVGCSGSQPPIGAPGPPRQASALPERATKTKYAVLYSFGDAPDGGQPIASLINVSGTLYGTTALGGTQGAGTAFSISTSGTEHVLHSFGRIRDGKRDGEHPQASLIDLSGTLYGTTYEGGGYKCGRADCGAVFSIGTSGAEQVVHSFRGPDGRNPGANLINVNGTLFGTTHLGGTYGVGTVFTIGTSGAEKVLHSFNDNGSDGIDPGTSLINVNGTLYGTTGVGGAYEGGTVFSITPSGTEKVLHSFGNGNDGAAPAASLINVNGTLYGTTVIGGIGHQQYGRGTVFSISTSGAEKVLYSFGGGSDGANPRGALIDVKGKLYGTTVYGGLGSGCGVGVGGCGTVFSVATSGTHKVLHSFGSSGTDGMAPEAGLIDVKGTLYGTTSMGGAHDLGTVFALTP